MGNIVEVMVAHIYGMTLYPQSEKTHDGEINGRKVQIGFVNRNMQENMGCLNKPGNHYNQMAYRLKCQNCNFEYEANGCDIAIRKCPNCM